MPQAGSDFLFLFFSSVLLLSRSTDCQKSLTAPVSGEEKGEVGNFDYYSYTFAISRKNYFSIITIFLSQKMPIRTNFNSPLICLFNFIVLGKLSGISILNHDTIIVFYCFYPKKNGIIIVFSTFFENLLPSFSSIFGQLIYRTRGICPLKTSQPDVRTCFGQEGVFCGLKVCAFGSRLGRKELTVQLLTYTLFCPGLVKSWLSVATFVEILIIYEFRFSSDNG